MTREDQVPGRQCSGLRTVAPEHSSPSTTRKDNALADEGLIAGLRAAMGLGFHRLLVKGDSQLVINQVSKEYQCTNP